MNRRIIGVIITSIIIISTTILYITRDTKESLAKELVKKNNIQYIVAARTINHLANNKEQKIKLFELFETEKNRKSISRPIVSFVKDYFTYKELKEMKELSAGRIGVILLKDNKNTFEIKIKEWANFLIQENEYKINKILEY